MIREANILWQYIDEESHLIMPWYVLPCLEWLKKQDIREWRVFEYGCGYSTIWWRNNCRHLKSIDHSEYWAVAMGCYPEKEKTKFIESSTIESPEFYKRFLWDCIIVDGKWREECVEFCLRYIDQGGYLIIDNWGQEDFPNTQKYLELLKDWKSIIFEQPNHSTWKTAIFQKP